MPPAAIVNFVDGLLQSQLFDAEKCEEVVRLQEKFSEPRALAKELLNRDWLTAYQVNQIFRGKAAALTIGPFVLLERIGKGGMGQVFKARQKPLNRIVALKLIRKECLGNPKTILRFLREIRAAGKLSHPHIVRTYDADQTGGTYYIAMELIDGVDLAKMVTDRGPLPVDQACEYIRQAALGLQHAHERGMVHRDIKPANLLIARGGAGLRRSSPSTPRQPADLKRTSALLPRVECYPWGSVKILDMGLARCTDPASAQTSAILTQVGSIMGTPEYIAPEQARDSHTSDIRADLYSLGCTLYYLLTGQAPFPHGTMAEKLLKHQNDEAPSVNEIRRARMNPDADERMLNVPAPVDELMRRLLSKQPADRWQTPVELANALQTILQQLASDARSTEAPIDLGKTQPRPSCDAVSPASPAEPMPMPQPMVGLQPNPIRSAKRARWLAVLYTALGATAVASVLTVAGMLMASGNPSRANTKNLEELRPNDKNDAMPKR